MLNSCRRPSQLEPWHSCVFERKLLNQLTHLLGRGHCLRADHSICTICVDQLLGTWRNSCRNYKYWKVGERRAHPKTLEYGHYPLVPALRLDINIGSAQHFPLREQDS